MTPSPFEAGRQSVTLGGQQRITIDYRDTPADQPSDMRRVAASIPMGGQFAIHRPQVVTVAGKPSLDVPPGTLNSILKQAGLKK